MIRSIAFCLITLATLCPLTQLRAENETLILQPSSNWHASFEPNGCRIVRTFGEGDQQISLIIDRFDLNDGFVLTISGRPLKRYKGHKSLTVKFGANEESQEIESAVYVEFNDIPSALINGMTIAAPTPDQIAFAQLPFDPKTYGTFRSEPIGKERYAAVKWIWFHWPNAEPLRLETGSLGAPFQVLADCADRMVASWGLDPDAQRNRSAPPIPRSAPYTWFTSYDYPGMSLIEGKVGVVHFRLDLDENGAATKCHILQESRPKVFGETVCRRFMRRAEFDPALDASGKPMKSYYVNRVLFGIP